MNLLTDVPGLRVLYLPFDHEDTTVLIGSYLSHDAAREDYRAAWACGAPLHGAILVRKDLDGEVSAEQSDHVLREGAEALGTLGLLTGLLDPPLIPITTGMGAVLGGVLGQTLHMLIESRAKDKVAGMIPLGCAVLILAFPQSSNDVVRSAVTRAISTSLGHGQGHHVEALRAAVADAQHHMAPGPV